MKTIGILFGMERTFPPALVEKINSMGIDGISAEFVKTGGIRNTDILKYDVILDRISQDIPFYRSLLKLAALGGTRVVNNPFWWSADDKFFNYSIATKIGVPVPKTVLLPSKQHPPETTSESMRNLIYPLNWDEVFDYVGFPSYLKPHSGGGWKHVYKVNNRQEFFDAYSKTGDIVMTLQEGIEFDEYYRCYCIGKKYVHIMPYEPRNPHHLRYVAGFTPTAERLEQLRDYCIRICNALGYEMNTIEFAVRDGIPYAIDYLNPAPDAEKTSVQEDNFDWVLEHTARYLVELAQEGRRIPGEYNWSAMISDTVAAPATAAEAAPAESAPAPKQRGRKPGTKIKAAEAAPAESAPVPKQRGRKPGTKIKADTAPANAPKGKRGRARKNG
jgi:glutathione synthase/RimK-type ligase-like ATP-grasp enzyme